MIRPADANEVIVAWHAIINGPSAPTALVLTRQNVPTLDRSKFAAATGLLKGAYVLAEAKNGKPDIILLATGSEVHLIVEAQEKLAAQNIAARVVSMPSWELFAAQSQEYRDSVLPPEIPLRLAVEAGVAQGWHQYIGDQGDIISVEKFGASAPGAIVMDKYGFNVDNVCQHAKKLHEKANK